MTEEARQLSVENTSAPNAVVSDDGGCGSVCFHCGEKGHYSAGCTLRGVFERTEAGKAAFDAYLESVQTFNLTSKTTKRPSRKKRNRKRLYHLHQLREWIAKQLLRDDTDGEACNDDDTVLIGDPVALVEQQKPRLYCDEDLQVVKHLYHSYREFFMMHMERIRRRFNTADEDGIVSTTGSTESYCSRRSKIEHDLVWQTKLNTAVRHGTPANFSKERDNWIYADNKLIPRSRYLYYLLLDDNAFSTRLRKKLLLPLAACSSTSQGTVTEPTDEIQRDSIVSVCSIGGGPGYDHLAIALVSWFLYKVQPQGNNEDELSSSAPRTIQTEVFDLYDQEWLPMLERLQECFVGEAEMEIEAKAKYWWRQNQMTMHHGDLRLNLFGDDADCKSSFQESIASRDRNGALLASVQAADIIVFQFVLHENASFLVDRETGFFVGTVASVLDDSGAKKGAFLICTDSSNTLWPALKKTAVSHGWDFLGDAEAEHKISLGPKAFVILEKIR